VSHYWRSGSIREGPIRSAFTFHLQGTRWWEIVSTQREEPSMIRRHCPEIPAIFYMPNVFVLVIRQRDYPSKSSALLLPSLRWTVAGVSRKETAGPADGELLVKCSPSKVSGMGIDKIRQIFYVSLEYQKRFFMNKHLFPDISSFLPGRRRPDGPVFLFFSGFFFFFFRSVHLGY